MLRRFTKGRVGSPASVRILAGEQVALSCRPIFLVGVFRSGTTLLRNVVDSHSRIACPPESRFLIPLSALVNERKYSSALQYLGFDREHVISRCRDFSAYFFENYARSRGKPRWADKTPRYVEHLEFVSELFPEAQYVIIHRHGLDVANSLAGWWANGEGTFLQTYVSKAGGEPRIGAALFWMSSVERILAFVRRNPSQCHTLRYEDLCADPESTLRPVFEFLEEPWEGAVLDYQRFSHDAGFADSRARRISGFDARSATYAQWPDEVLVKAFEAVGSALQLLGYDTEGA